MWFLVIMTVYQIHLLTWLKYQYCHEFSLKLSSFLMITINGAFRDSNVQELFYLLVDFYFRFGLVALLCRCLLYNFLLLFLFKLSISSAVIVVFFFIYILQFGLLKKNAINWTGSDSSKMSHPNRTTCNFIFGLDTFCPKTNLNYMTNNPPLNDVI